MTSSKACSLGLHTFSEKLLDEDIYFQVIRLEESFHIWVGTSTCKFGDDSSVAIQTKFDNQPTVTRILGGTDSQSVALSQKLSKRTGKMVMVTFSVPYKKDLIPLIESRIIQEMKNKADCF